MHNMQRILSVLCMINKHLDIYIEFNKQCSLCSVVNCTNDIKTFFQHKFDMKYDSV